MRTSIIVLFTIFIYSFGFNLDILNPILYEDFLSETPERGSYFGYSVVMHSGASPWILIGAPRSNLSLYVNVTEPGVSVQCSIGGSCSYVELDSYGNEEPSELSEIWDDKNHAWIGVSSAIQENENSGRVVVCGHRWKNQIDLKKYNQLHMIGVCYTRDIPNGSPTKMILLKRPYIVKRKNVATYQFGMGQSGSHIHFVPRFDLEDRRKILVGAPGTFNWQGTVVICEDKDDFSHGTQKRSVELNAFGSCLTIRNITLMKDDESFPYIGYTVSSGRFFKTSEYLITAGAPRLEFHGGVIIFKYDSSAYVFDILKGETMGEYFGASLAVCDINNNSLDELIVGAPLYSSNKDEGRIYVFTRINEKRKEMKLLQIIDGVSSGAQFGLSISSLGHLNQDEYDDIAVGAPYANDGRGTVYIYNGYPDGFKLSQKIDALELFPNLRGFGISLSNAADVDHNGLKDIAVGSYLSGHVVLLRTSPVIVLMAEINSTMYLIPKNVTEFALYPYVLCQGCNGTLPFSVSLHLEVDAKYEQAFVDKELNRHEYYKDLEIIGDSIHSTNLVVYIKKEPDTQQGIEIKLSIEVPTKTKNIVLIKKDVKEGDDAFCKNCPVVDTLKSQLVDMKTVKFVNDCGNDEICQSCLQTSCHMISHGLGGNSTYILGSEDPVTLQIGIVNHCEPAYSVIVIIKGPKQIEPEKIPRLCKQTKNGEILCETGNIYKEATFQKNISIDFDVKKITQFAFSNGKISHLNFSVMVNTTSNDIKNASYCSTVLQLERKSTLKITGLSSPDYVLLKDSDEHVKHLYKVVKEGPSPVKQEDFEVVIPTDYKINDNEFINFLSPKNIWIDQNRRDISCKLPFRNLRKNSALQMQPTDEEESFERRKRMAELATDSTEDEIVKTVSENKTVFLNCSSPKIKCQKVMCTASELLSHNSFFDVPINMELNITALKKIAGTKTTIIFTTAAYVEIVLPEGLSEKSDKKSLSITIITEKPYEPIAAWIIVLAIIGGILLLCLLVYGMKKAGFFRRKKKELLLSASLQTAEET